MLVLALRPANEKKYKSGGSPEVQLAGLKDLHGRVI